MKANRNQRSCTVPQQPEARTTNGMLTIRALERIYKKNKCYRFVTSDLLAHDGLEPIDVQSFMNKEKRTWRTQYSALFDGENVTTSLQGTAKTPVETTLQACIKEMKQYHERNGR